MAAADRQLVVAVEGTAALGPYWSTIVAEYVEKIVRYVRAPGPLFSSVPFPVAGTALSFQVLVSERRGTCQLGYGRSGSGEISSCLFVRV